MGCSQFVWISLRFLLSYASCSWRSWPSKFTFIFPCSLLLHFSLLVVSCLLGYPSGYVTIGNPRNLVWHLRQLGAGRFTNSRSPIRNALENPCYQQKSNLKELRKPWRRRTSIPMLALTTGRRTGPITVPGLTTMTSNPFSSVNFQAAFSANVFEAGYQIYHVNKNKMQVICSDFNKQFKAIDLFMGNNFGFASIVKQGMGEIP